MNTIETNELLAKFMYLRFDPEMNEYYFPVYNSGDWHSPDELLFHESWDWLMRVVREIRSHDYHSQDIDEINNHLVRQDLEGTYKACVNTVNKINKFFQS
jgi:hypothetical protein